MIRGARARRPRKERTPQGESDSRVRVVRAPPTPVAGGLGMGVGTGSSPGNELGACVGPGGARVLWLRSQKPTKVVASTP